jgi:hypothetical protein
MSEFGRANPVAVGDDGWSEWLHPVAPSFFSQCCDCGLIHEMEFEIVPRDEENVGLNPGESDAGVIIFRVRRSDASGMEARRAAAENTDAVHDSPIPQGDAQRPPQ